MFKITQNTVRYFTLAEVLFMAAMNQFEDMQKVSSNERGLCHHYALRAEAA